MTYDYAVVDYDGQEVEGCPACGNAPDYCPGHGPTGDPVGYALLQEAGWVEDDGLYDENGDAVDEIVDPAEDDGLRACTDCGFQIAQADDGTWFVYGTGTTADGLAQCPPNPDGGYYTDPDHPSEGEWVEYEYGTHTPQDGE